MVPRARISQADVAAHELSRDTHVWRYEPGTRERAAKATRASSRAHAAKRLATRLRLFPHEETTP